MDYICRECDKKFVSLEDLECHITSLLSHKKMRKVKLVEFIDEVSLEEAGVEVSLGHRKLFKLKDGTVLYLSYALDLLEVIFFEDECNVKQCQCTLCFCYKTKKHIDLNDIDTIIHGVKVGNPVSECLDRLFRDESRLEQEEKIKAQEIEIEERSIREVKRMERIKVATDYRNRCQRIVSSANYKEKPPLHPGKIAHDLLWEQGHRHTVYHTCPDNMDNYFETLNFGIIPINKDILSKLIDGKFDIEHVLAYKLANLIDNTDVRFWMDLQERYDDYMRNNK